MANEFNQQFHVISEVVHGQVSGMWYRFVGILHDQESVPAGRRVILEDGLCPVVRSPVQNDDVKRRGRQVLCVKVGKQGPDVLNFVENGDDHRHSRPECIAHIRCLSPSDLMVSPSMGPMA